MLQFGWEPILCVCACARVCVKKESKWYQILSAHRMLLLNIPPRQHSQKTVCLCGRDIATSTNLPERQEPKEVWGWWDITRDQKHGERGAAARECVVLGPKGEKPQWATGEPEWALAPARTHFMWRVDASSPAGPWRGNKNPTR